MIKINSLNSHQPVDTSNLMPRTWKGLGMRVIAVGTFATVFYAYADVFDKATSKLEVSLGVHDSLFARTADAYVNELRSFLHRSPVAYYTTLAIMIGLMYFFLTTGIRGYMKSEEFKQHMILLNDFCAAIDKNCGIGATKRKIQTAIRSLSTYRDRWSKNLRSLFNYKTAVIRHENTLRNVKSYKFRTELINQLQKNGDYSNDVRSLYPSACKKNKKEKKQKNSESDETKNELFQEITKNKEKQALLENELLEIQYKTDSIAAKLKGSRKVTWDALFNNGKSKPNDRAIRGSDIINLISNPPLSGSVEKQDSGKIHIRFGSVNKKVGEYETLHGNPNEYLKAGQANRVKKALNKAMKLDLI